MRKLKLKNGLRVIWEKKDCDAVAIEINVGVGSNNEDKRFAGISHFLEHMLFEGTKTRSSMEISETIENVGGEINAGTTKERTFFYLRIPKKKVDLGLDILSDIIKNPLFDAKILEKERRVILEEIKMVNDQPLIYQWIFFERNLFKRHSAKNPVYGSAASVSSISRKNISSHYKKWYFAENMVLSVVGNFKDFNERIEKCFGNIRSGSAKKMRKEHEPEDLVPTMAKEKRGINQSYFVLGFKTVPRMHDDSYALDVVSAFFYKGLSGRIAEEIRVKRGLAYSVGTANEAEKEFGFFAFFLNCDKSSIEICRKIILDEIKNLNSITDSDLTAAKDHLIGKNILNNEISNRLADDLAFWEFVRDAKLAGEYEKNIRKVSKADILRVAKKYFKDNYTLAIISK